MGLRFRSLADIPAQLASTLNIGVHKRSKYGNRKTVVDGITFDSKREALYYKRLRLLQATGVIRGFARQVSILLPSGHRLRLDFVVVENDGRIRWVDAKGYMTTAWGIKRDEAQAALGVVIELV